MPNLDKTGPKGEGTKTGRGLGQCDQVAPVVGMGGGRRRVCRRSIGLGLGLGRGLGQKTIINEPATDTKKK